MQLNGKLVAPNPGVLPGLHEIPRDNGSVLREQFVNR